MLLKFFIVFSFYFTSAQSLAVNLGQGVCQDVNGTDYDRLWYSSIMNVTQCEGKCEVLPNCRGFNYIAGTYRCLCYFDDNSVPYVPNDGVYTDFNGTGVTLTLGTVSITTDCYNFTTTTTWQPTNYPTRAPTDPPTKYPTRSPVPPTTSSPTTATTTITPTGSPTSLGNSPGETTASPTASSNTGATIGIIFFNVVVVIAAVVVVWYYFIYQRK